MNQLQLMEEQIKTFPKVYPAYKHASETGGINPLYSEIEHCPALLRGEKIIWILRCDLILAVGIKHDRVYAKAGNTNLRNKIDKLNYPYVDFDIRYGHPSLALPENDYDGSAYLGGWLRIHRGRIDVYLLSGRYKNVALTSLQQKCLEEYLTIKFRLAYGEHDVVFWDHDNDEEIFLFIGNQNFPVEKTRREYLTQNLSSFSIFQPQASESAEVNSDALKPGI